MHTKGLPENPGESERLFPDEHAPMTNCFGYVYYKLGLDPKKVSTLVDFNDFVLVPDIQGADAILFRDTLNRQQVHMVYRGVDGTISHRRNYGRPIEATSIEKLQERYKPERYEMIFLRVK